jgi:nucleoside-diphosphate-sugar epimerase
MNVEVWSMNKILITGAAGYIGSMLCTMLLVNKKNFVTGVDLLKYDKNSLSHLYKNKNFNFICADIRKDDVIKKITKNQDFIFPLAALVGAPLCEKFKKKYNRNKYKFIKKIN